MREGPGGLLEYQWPNSSAWALFEVPNLVAEVLSLVSVLPLEELAWPSAEPSFWNLTGL